MFRSFLLVAVAAVLVVAPATASQAEPEGVPRFGLDIQFFGEAKIGEPLRLLVGMSGAYSKGTPIEAKIVLPASMELVSGDLSRSAKADRSVERWEVFVRPTRPGEQRIVASFVGVVSEREKDEGDFVLAIDVGNATDGGVSRRTRSEKVVDAQRYRYGGDFLVPIEGPEDFNQNDIRKSGVKPHATSEAAATCRDCGTDLPEAVTFVAFIDKTGRLVDARVLGPASTDPVVAAARAALATWRFKPSTYAGRPVADWLVVKVPVSR